MLLPDRRLRPAANYNLELTKKNVYSAKPLEVRAHDEAKVRTMFLPVMFDDQGFQKKWTEKEKKEFRGETMMPGYPSDFDAIKSGQRVTVANCPLQPPVEIDYWSDFQTVVHIRYPNGTLETITLMGQGTEHVQIAPNGTAADTDADGRDQASAEMTALDLHGVTT